jgi:hypothetical protein
MISCDASFLRQSYDDGSVAELFGSWILPYVEEVFLRLDLGTVANPVSFDQVISQMVDDQLLHEMRRTSF